MFVYSKIRKKLTIFDFQIETLSMQLMPLRLRSYKELFYDAINLNHQTSILFFQNNEIFLLLFQFRKVFEFYPIKSRSFEQSKLQDYAREKLSFQFVLL